MTERKRQEARARLDERFAAMGAADVFTPPPKGWIRAIRDAIGMTRVQFAGRLGMTPQSAADLERSEASGAVQIKTLQRAAAALDCTLVYALVPKSGGLENQITTRARNMAVGQLSFVEHSLWLEGNALTQTDARALIESYTQEILDAGTFLEDES